MQTNLAFAAALGAGVFTMMALDSRFTLIDAIKARKKWGVVRVLFPPLLLAGIFALCIYKANTT